MSTNHRALALVPFAAFVLAEGTAYVAAVRSADGGPRSATQSLASRVIPRAFPHPAGRRIDGYLVTMSLIDTSGSVNFNIKVAGDAFSLGLTDLLPLMSRGLGGALGSLGDAAAMAGGAMSTATAGAYLLAQDSSSLMLVLPTVNMAMSLDPGVVMAAAGRGGRGGPGGNNGYNGGAGGGGGRGGRGGGGGAGGGGGGGGGAVAGDTTTNQRGRGGRGGRAVATDSTATTNVRGGGGRQFTVDSSIVYDSTTRVKVENLGDGEPLLSHPTRHYRIHTSASLIPIASCKGATSADMIIDGSFATDLSGGAFARFFSLVPMLQGSGVAAQGNDTVPVKLPRGFPMKTVASCDTPTRDPVLTLQVIEIDPASFDPSEFDLPMGIQMINMNAVGGRGGRAGGGGGGGGGGGAGGGRRGGGAG